MGDGLPPEAGSFASVLGFATAFSDTPRSASRYQFSAEDARNFWASDNAESSFDIMTVLLKRLNDVIAPRSPSSENNAYIKPAFTYNIALPDYNLRRWGEMDSAREVETELGNLAPQISVVARETLVRMYSSSVLDGTEEKARAIGQEKISILQGSELNRILRDIKAARTLEIGFAYGFSTIWLLDAVATNGGTHNAIDPFEKRRWSGVGLHQVNQTPGFDKLFKWHEAFSIHALSDFIRSGETFDAVFIDGNHRFDDVVVDFYLADQVLRVGGIMAFDDMWMDSVKSVASFVALNRHYELVPQRADTMAAFRKIANDDRLWDHYIPFETVHDRQENRALRLARYLRRRFLG
jgi:predicted O-methyltransferase YrrM